MGKMNVINLNGEKVKDINHPIIVHINTLKGYGLKVAEENKEKFHWILAGTLDEKPAQNEAPAEDYYSVTNNYILNKAKEDKIDRMLNRRCVCIIF